MNVKALLADIFDKTSLIRATFSNPRFKKPEEPNRITLRSIEIKGTKVYQLTKLINNQEFHSNLDSDKCQHIILSEVLPAFKQGLLQTRDKDYQLLTNRKGDTTIITKEPSKAPSNLAHNRTKNYILPEGKPIPFLCELELMNAQGRVFPQKMDKFRQINRFLEMVADVLPHLDKQKHLHIVDFGCGKAYLTFALYHFLHEIEHYNVTMVGLDLKRDVIEDCQRLANKLNFTNLTFQMGDIANYASKTQVDMVVALHACDTATDKALEKAVRWQAKVILAAPCCQHELYSQIASQSLDALLQYGILKERLAALATDAARVQVLEICGYHTQILEFIDSIHTPKNLLIRAVYGNTKEQRAEANKRYQDLKATLNLKPSAETLLRATEPAIFKP